MHVFSSSSLKLTYTRDYARGPESDKQEYSRYLDGELLRREGLQDGRVGRQQRLVMYISLSPLITQPTTHDNENPHGVVQKGREDSKQKYTA